MRERKSFVFHAEWAHGIRKLSKDLRADIYDAIVEYGLSGTMPSGLKPVAEAVLTMVRARMDAERERYEEICAARRCAGQRGGQAKASKSSNCQQMQANASKAKQVQPDTDTDTDTDKEKERERESETAPIDDERNDAERKARSLAPSKFFGDFWDAFPRTARKTARNKAFAIEIWREMRLDERREQIMAALEWWKGSSQWSDFNFVPAPQNWLRGGSWDIDTNSVREASKQASSLKESHTRKLTPAQLKTAEEDYERLLSTKAEIGLTPDQEAELKELREKINSSYNT